MSQEFTPKSRITTPPILENMTRWEEVTDSPASRRRGTNFLEAFIRSDRLVDIKLAASALHLKHAQLAETIGIDPTITTDTTIWSAANAQDKLRKLLEIVRRVRDWAGGDAKAMAWYREQPIPALGSRTSEALVKAGQAQAVGEYLDHLAWDGYA
jgi:hypothetical protein